MDFSEIASVAGKSGLFKVFNPTRNGLILESLNDQSKLVVGPTSKVSILAEISIFTTSTDGSEPLDRLMQKIYKEFKDDIGITGSADPQELRAFLKHVLPEYDDDRVYVSDIKKLVNWYNCIVKQLPEMLVEKEEKPTEEKKEKKPKKTQKSKEAGDDAAKETK
ncbi:MAG: DUF5606 domain-containing protein [Bacteroidetes bacterium]|nr:DUF5606 domain-containing protein [Bacteroidota bacterium]MDA1121888.1 DUF5606 domain-containing protein [Bacteroidota bacterium]